MYFAIKDQAAQFAEAGPGYYEETSPAVNAGTDQWTAVIAPNASGQAILLGNGPGSSLTFAFRGSEAYLHALAGPEGGQLLITLDGHNVEGLSLDKDGRSFVELYAPQERLESFLVFQNGSARRRTLRVAVSDYSHPDSGGKQCAIDAFQVEQNASQPFPIIPAAALFVACVGVGWLLGRSTMNARPRR